MDILRLLIILVVLPSSSSKQYSTSSTALSTFLILNTTRLTYAQRKITFVSIILLCSSQYHISALLKLKKMDIVLPLTSLFDTSARAEQFSFRADSLYGQSKTLNLNGDVSSILTRGGGGMPGNSAKKRTKTEEGETLETMTNEVLIRHTGAG